MPSEEQMVEAFADAMIDPDREWSDIERGVTEAPARFWGAVSRVIHRTHSHFNGTRWVPIGEF